MPSTREEKMVQYEARQKQYQELWDRKDKILSQLSPEDRSELEMIIKQLGDLRITVAEEKN